MDLGARATATCPRAFASIVVGDSISRTISAEPTATTSSRSTSVGVTAGVEYGFGSGVVGVAGQLSRPKANFGNDNARDDEAETRSRSASMPASASPAASSRAMPAMAATATTSTAAAWSTTLDAEPDGSHMLAGVKAGYLMPLRQPPRRPGRRARLCPRQGRRLYRGGRPGADPQRRRARAIRRCAAASAPRCAATSAAMASSCAPMPRLRSKRISTATAAPSVFARPARRASSTATRSRTPRKGLRPLHRRAQRAILSSVSLDATGRPLPARIRATKPRPSSACASVSNRRVKQRRSAAGAAPFLLVVKAAAKTLAIRGRRDRQRRRAAERDLDLAGTERPLDGAAMSPRRGPAIRNRCRPRPP